MIEDKTKEKLPAFGENFAETGASADTIARIDRHAWRAYMSAALGGFGFDATKLLAASPGDALEEAVAVCSRIADYALEQERRRR